MTPASTSATAPPARRGGRQQLGRFGLATGNPSTDLRVVSSEAFAVGRREHCTPHIGVEPPVGVERVLGIEGEAGCEHLAGRLGGGAEPVDVRPRPLGVHVVGRQR